MMCEEILGRHLWGHVSRTGSRPPSVKALYDMNAPFVETLQQATHFKRGPEVQGETRRRYVFRSKTDEDRELIMTVIAFNIPQTSPKS